MDRNCLARLVRVAIVLAVSLSTVPSLGNIYLDEDFEGTPAFADRNWPVTNDTAAPVAPLGMGCNLRAFSPDAAYTSPKVQFSIHNGSVVSDRRHTGTKCLRLQSGQGLRVDPGQFPFRNGNWFRVWQFAVSTDAATVALPAGTVAGHFQIDYANASTTSLVPDVSIILRVQVNASGGADLLCVNDGKKLGTLSGAADDWLLVSILAMNKVTQSTFQDSTEPWAAYDPLSLTFKGPQPNPGSPPISTGVHIYVDKPSSPTAQTVLTRAAHLGTTWGNEDGQGSSLKANTSEIGWEFAAENAGTIYLDNLYWDAGYHQSTTRGFDNEQAARLEPFALNVAAPDPGIPSSIHTIYVVSQTHVDIGFDYPPEDMRQKNKEWIDTQIAYARTHPGFRYTIEHTWMFENWRTRSTSEQITELVGLLRSGQFALGAAHSTLHSGKAGVEQVNRLLWNAERARQSYGIPVDTVLFNDVPGVAWSYPQAMARSGMKYLVCGLNLFIGGGFDQPYPSFLFWWQGPDGSRVLTWSTENGYVEGWNTYGIPFGTSGTVNKTTLTAALKALTDAGYPYDAILVEHSSDARISQAEYDAASAWNATYQNPRILPATAHEFFEYMESKYASQIPVRSGNWTSPWDTGQMVEPRAEKIVKNAQDLIPAAEKAWAIASTLGKEPYPGSDFDNAWDMQLTENEHAGAGGCWDYYWTQAQVDAANQQYWDYALGCEASTSSTLDSAQAALLGVMTRNDRDIIAVFNPLSWTRTDLVRLPVSPSLFAETFTLVDAVTLQNIPYQKEAATQEILFVASDLPPLGLKRFDIVHSAPPAAGTSLVVGTNSVENRYYRVEVDSTGYVSSLVDKRNSRQLVNGSSTFDFNRTFKSTNLDYFFGVAGTVPDPVSPTITTGMEGPVAASLRVTNPSHPVARSEIVLYDALDRIDLVDTPDRSRMEYAPYSVNSLYYGFTFPLNLTGFTTRIDTAAGWLNPVVDSLSGSFTAQYAVQHGVDLSETGYGVTFAAPDVFVHSVGAVKTWAYPPAEATVVSTFVRYGDETKLKGGAIGTVVVEPGASPQWDLRYALRPHLRGFDSVADARFGWEAGTPVMAAHLPSASGGVVSVPSLSFFSSSAPAVVITNIKKADFGAGIIVKLQEVARSSAETTFYSSYFEITSAWATTPLEEDLAPVSVTGSHGITVSLGPSEIKTLRLALQNPTAPNWVEGWMLY